MMPPHSNPCEVLPTRTLVKRAAWTCRWSFRVYQLKIRPFPSNFLRVICPCGCVDLQRAWIELHVQVHSSTINFPMQFPHVFQLQVVCFQVASYSDLIALRKYFYDFLCVSHFFTILHLSSPGM